MDRVIAVTSVREFGKSTLGFIDTKQKFWNRKLGAALQGLVHDCVDCANLFSNELPAVLTALISAMKCALFKTKMLTNFTLYKMHIYIKCTVAKLGWMYDMN